MKRSGLICFVLLLVALGVDARNTHGKKQRSAERTTLADPAEGYYDIKHLKFDLQVADTSVFVKGNVTTTAQALVPMSSYVFELDSLMNIDSAKINGTLVTVTRVGFVRTIALPSMLPIGSVFKAQVFYHGVPPPGGGFFNGLRHTISAGGTHMLYSISDPWVAKVWWPVKQSVNDLIDSVDMFITMPGGVADGSNGLLVGIDNITTPGYSTYHWKTNYPIAYYLICINVAKYGEYKSYWHFTGSPDSMLIQNFFMDTTTFNATSKINFDSIGLMIDYFSSLYGRYPFWREKYGVCFTDLLGGMEHQTMTTIGVTDTRTIAHELTHQWFGDNVTYESWHETWLSEGFATYAEQLYYAQFWSAAKAKSHRQSLLSSALSRPCGMIYVNDTTKADSLFDQRTVYNKAQGIINTLRYMAPADSLFFSVLKTYQQNFAGKNASTADFKNIVETTYGINLDTFFNQWIYGRGFPIYKASWYQSGTTVFVKLIQTQSCPSYTKHFSTPLQLQLHGATTDTFIKVYNSLDTQTFTFDWTPAMTNLYVNPDVWTVCRVSTPISKDSTLSIGAVTEDHNIRIFPNPSKNYWQVEHLAHDAGLVLTDINGRVLWRGNSINGSALVPGERLPSGNYLLKVTGTNSTESIRLVRW